MALPMKGVIAFAWGALGPLSTAYYGSVVYRDIGHFNGWDALCILFILQAVISQGCQELNKKRGIHVARMQ